MSDKQEHTRTDADPVTPTTESWLSRHAPYVLLLAFLFYGTQLAIGLFNVSWDFYEVLLMVPNGILALLAFAGVGVAVRVAALLFRRASLLETLRAILGEPTWWRTSYPHVLRSPGNVWDRLPTTLKVLRTLIWLELLLLPAGFVLVVFVTPTFEVVYASVGAPFPLLLGMFISAVSIGGYLLPMILLGAVLQGRRWRGRLGLPGLVAFNAFFSVSPDFWRNTDAKRLLLEP